MISQTEQSDLLAGRPGERAGQSQHGLVREHFGPLSALTVMSSLHSKLETPFLLPLLFEIFLQSAVL